ncbi:uncharacterized protein LOC142565974 [Dermacentor variabilis]|uniref:uncharacterized protein LOC142565974 n=1 Tax=Dermacentor variabilis TaxID=34621 RepID=UPI003F5B56F2
MLISSPGLRSFLWAASLPTSDISLEAFLRSGSHNVPVALVPTYRGFIRVKNPKTIQEKLRKATRTSGAQPMSDNLAEGAFCFVRRTRPVSDLLNCGMFANHPDEGLSLRCIDAGQIVRCHHHLCYCWQCSGNLAIHKCSPMMLRRAAQKSIADYKGERYMQPIIPSTKGQSLWVFSNLEDLMRCCAPSKSADVNHTSLPK